MASPARVLIVDDEPDICETLSDYLTGRGYAVETRSSAEAAEERLAAGGLEALILDLKLPGRDWLELLEGVRARDPDLCVLIFTGYATADSAIEALRKNADDYFEKPLLGYDVLARALARALERRRLKRANRRLVARLRRANQKLGRRGQVLRERVAEATRNLRFLLDLARELGRDLDPTRPSAGGRAGRPHHARAHSSSSGRRAATASSRPQPR
jgi:two-component system response regulator GlrR